MTGTAGCCAVQAPRSFPWVHTDATGYGRDGSVRERGQPARDWPLAGVDRGVRGPVNLT
jgi:hypothetical protein